MKRSFAAVAMFLLLLSPTIASSNVEAGPIQKATAIIMGTIVMLVFLVLFFGAYAVKRNDEGKNKE